MNINEIAKMAGVSRATVSRYLNDGYVSKEKREAIGRVIEETGYQPSSQAQTLRTRRTKLIGVILPKINSDTVSRMVAGISQVLNQKDYRIILANTANQVEEEWKYLALFQENQVDGVILIGTIFTKKHRKLMEASRVPIVVLGQKLEGYPCVYQDEFHASRELTECLLQYGRNIGYIGVTQKDEAAGLGRRKGFEAALKRQKRTCPLENRRETTFRLEGGYRAAKELMEKNSEIDTIFCATDTIAVGALVYLRERGIQVPGQVQVAGMGDTQLGQVMAPALTSIHFFYKTSGMEAARMMVDLLENEEAVIKEIRMGYELKIRQSTRSHSSSWDVPQGGQTAQRNA